jgi:hypothetical protein
MIGWHISIYRQRDGGSSPAEFETLEGARLAVWQTSWGGLGWFDELVKQDKAIDLGGSGYPLRYTAQARYLTGRVLVGPPDANETWVRGPQDVVTDKWAGRTVVDGNVVGACAPDEWLIVEAWDES